MQGLFSTASSMYATFKSTEVEQIKADVETAKVSAQIIQTTNDDIALRMMRDAYCLPAVVHVLFDGWDTIIAESTWVPHSWMWHLAKFPPSYEWYPTTVAVFLLGNIGLNTWKRLKL